MFSAPYLSLIDLIDARRPVTELDRARSFRDPDATNVLHWCSQHGLLGLFFLEVRQVTLYPRWELRGGPNRNRVATLRQFIMQPTRWEQRAIGGSGTLDAMLLPDDKKEVGALVSKEYWDKGWEPGAIRREHVSGIYWNSPVGETFRDFFPSVPKDEQETHPYPPPMSEKFWRSYAEREDQFLRIANNFADTVRTLGRARSAGDTMDVSDTEIRQACEYLESIVASVNAGLFVQKDRTLDHHWVAGSLLASFGMMALEDAARGWLNTCSNCSRVFVSTAGRARYCSTRCRKTALQRSYRDRKEKRNVQARTT